MVTASYLLPVDPQWGDMRASATYAYIDEMQAVAEAASIYATLPDYSLVNLNFDWTGHWRQADRHVDFRHQRNR